MPIDDTTLAFLLTHELQQAFQTWDKNQPARTGLHASSVLESDADFCTRQHVLAEVFPHERQQKEQFWRVLAMFANGWSIHQKWQWDILQPTGMVDYEEVVDDDPLDLDFVPQSYSIEYELDRTHIDPVTNIHYSPDAIIEFAGQRMAVEIKGINTLDFRGTPALYERDFSQSHLYADGFTYKLVEEGREGVKDATLEEAMARNKSIRSAVPQLNLYLHLLGLEKGIILAEDKNTQDFMIWVWTYDPEMAKKPISRAAQVETARIHYHVADELPEGICKTVNDSRAKRCPFRDACFQEGR